VEYAEKIAIMPDNSEGKSEGTASTIATHSELARHASVFAAQASVAVRAIAVSTTNHIPSSPIMRYP
jgi:hypothetical protein